MPTASPETEVPGPAELVVLVVTMTFIYRLFFRKSGKPEIAVVTTVDECTEACKALLKKMELKTLGFDAEWITTEQRRPVALLQLSTRNYCALFRLNVLKTIPEALKNILTREDIIKVGIVPEKDASYILNDYGVTTKSTLDLRHLYKTDSGLSKLSSDHLKKPLDKTGDTSWSNWENTELTKEQISYAAQDGVVAFELYKLFHGKNSIKCLNDIINSSLNRPFDPNELPKDNGRICVVQ